MPLVRISLMKQENKEFGRKIGQIVHQEMVRTINVPEKDCFQVITEHDNNSLIYDSNYLGIHRSDGIVFIQITLNEGRGVDLKKSLYKNIADSLHNQLDIRREDVLISLVEVKKENWSFGNGIAQYA
ncbi:tautomerase family protein [Methylomonas sp. LW13]|uniref:tautomerase family protein n=1 Tax=unclassified Methylomonas TaxID=2608980 RepID=UPI00051CA05D|nr:MULTISPECIES: tautomerase family protein [unclassified Methylomonas]PKD39212.1 tautomerase family protein [Methylomonas sp. Kb3]QBC25515.1 tautomerase family protein [Methylomonas sp. LW13]